MRMPLRFQDQVAIVTGGGGGIGGATCLRLAQEGARVMVVDLVEADARRVAEAITEAGGQAGWHAANLTELPAAEAMAMATLARFGRIDVLVNTAGGSAGPAIQSTPKDFAHSDPARWQEMITLNLVGTLTPARAVVNHLIAQKSGSIVNVSSLAGVLGGTNLADYSAAKGGVIQFTVSLAKELAPFGIRVNSIAPGTVGTDRIKGLPADTRQEYLSGIRLGRFGTPEEMAAAITFLASPDASYITGQNLNVDGGWGLGPAKL